MMNPLLGCDPKEVSPARAGAVFAEFAKNRAAEKGIDLTQAWREAKELHPDLHARLCEAAPTTPTTLANTIQTPAIPLASKSLLLPAFHLPPLTSDEVFSAAYRANGNQSSKIDSQKTFMALVAYTIQKLNVNAAAARRQVREDYPELARVAGQLTD